MARRMYHLVEPFLSEIQASLRPFQFLFAVADHEAALVLLKNACDLIRAPRGMPM